MTAPFQRRLAALETRRTSAVNYLLCISDEDQADLVAFAAALVEHRRVTGWMGSVIAAPPELTIAEWAVSALAEVPAITLAVVLEAGRNSQ